METSASAFNNVKVSGHVPQDLYLRKNVSVSLIGRVIDNLSEATIIGLESLGYNGQVDQNSLARAMRTVFNLRIMQVCKMKPVAGFRPTDYKVWSILFPVLAQIGIYRDEAAGYELYPSCEGVSVTVDDIDHLNMVVTSLAYWGLSYSMGLPKDVTIESDEIYKLSVKSEEVIGHKTVPAPVVVMSRLFFEIEALSEIYGESRVAYSTIRYLQQVFIDVTLSQLKNPSSIKT